MAISTKATDFVGVDNGNLDAGESLTFTLHEADGDLITFEGIQIGTKSAQGGTYTWVAHIAGGGITDTVTGTGDRREERND